MFSQIFGDMQEFLLAAPIWSHILLSSLWWQDALVWLFYCSFVWLWSLSIRMRSLLKCIDSGIHPSVRNSLEVLPLVENQKVSSILNLCFVQLKDLLLRRSYGFAENSYKNRKRSTYKNNEALLFPCIVLCSLPLTLKLKPFELRL